MQKIQPIGNDKGSRFQPVTGYTCTEGFPVAAATVKSTFRGLLHARWLFRPGSSLAGEDRVKVTGHARCVLDEHLVDDRLTGRCRRAAGRSKLADCMLSPVRRIYDQATGRRSKLRASLWSMAVPGGSGT